MGEPVSTNQYLYVKGIKLSEVAQVAEKLQAERGNNDTIFFNLEADGTLTERRIIMDDVQEGCSVSTSV